MTRALRRLAALARKAPLDAAAWAVFAVASALVIARPLAAATYPPLTDLPMHAAQTGALRHFWDPAWHLQEQFTLHPLEVPYLSTYVLGALLSLALPMITAVKVATGLALLALPAGLAVLARGAGRSPLLGAAGLGLVWTNLTEWGFVNFVCAIGLFAMSVGFALLVLERPSPARRWGLALSLLALFFTHLFRYPFALGGIALAAAATWPAGGRARALVLPVLPSLALFGLWTRIRPTTLDTTKTPPLDLHPERAKEIPDLFFRSFHDKGERLAEEALRSSLALVAAALVVLWLLERAGASSLARPARRDRRFRLGAALVPLGCAAACFLSFFTLPMQIGVWWYVYPREIVAAAALSLACLPDLPRLGVFRLGAVVALVLPALGMERVVTRNHAQFDRATRDFDAVVAKIPPAPKLLYLVFDHGGSTRTVTPFIHLPAYVQATRGGWLSFHFAVFGASPLRYRDRREPGAVIPPEMMTRWEWRPDAFRMEEHGEFFDWFLVRRAGDPRGVFDGDPRVELVAHEGTWWLFHKRAASP